MKQASIITIGDELLIGQVVDTNSAWMAQELNKSGVWVRRRVAVGDVWDDIWNALDQESAQNDIILITGGLGPTADDITKDLLCAYFKTTLVVDPVALANVKYLFEQVFQRPMIDRNLKQAEVPANATIIQNKRGTAPGMLFSRDGKIFISLPGVPHEMKGMITDFVIPWFRAHFSLPAIAHRTLLAVGIGESFLAEHIKSFESDLPQNVKLAYLPNYGMVRLRLTATGENENELIRQLDPLFADLKSRTAEWMATDEDIPFQAAIGNMLKSRGRTLATAESCTGGYIAHLITSIAGASVYFKGAIVPYDNSIKTKALQVPVEILQTVGAVSEETVRGMVTGALTLFSSDYAVATSGILGPGGGTPEKPVGTIWIAVGNSEKTVTQKLNLRFDRERNMQLTATNVLNLLRKFILSDPS